MVATAFTVHVSAIYRLITHFQQTKPTADIHRSGRRRVTNAHADRQIVYIFRANVLLQLQGGQRPPLTPMAKPSVAIAKVVDCARQDLDLADDTMVQS